MHISVHVSLQYFICPFFGQIKAFFSHTVSYFSQTFTKLMLLTLWFDFELKLKGSVVAK